MHTKIKIKTKIILGVICIAFFSGNTNAGWDKTTAISNTKVFQKQQGIHTLLLKQKKIENPYTGKTITVQGGAYYINGSYYGMTPPNQQKVTWITAQKTYKYDSVKPSCQGVRLFKDGTDEEVSLGGWTNQEIKAEISCFDGGSGCTQDTIRVNAVYKQAPQTTFSDNAGNSNTCEGKLNGKLILIDKKKTKIEDIKMNNYTFSNLAEDPGLSSLARGENKKFIFTIRDHFDSEDTNGVSGIESFDFSIQYISNHKGKIFNSEICHVSKVYGEFNPLINGNVSNDEDIKNIIINCNQKYVNNKLKITKSGKYELTLLVNDFAGNINTQTREFTILPNIINATKSNFSIDSGDKYANNSDKYTIDLILRDEFGNEIYDKKINKIQQNKYIKTKDNSDGLIEEGYDELTDSNGKLRFTIKSLSPGEFTPDFDLTFTKWGDDYIQNLSDKNINLSITGTKKFLKPFTGVMNVVASEGTNKKPKVTGHSQKYNLVLENKGSLNTSGTVNISSSTIINSIHGHDWNNFQLIDGEFNAFNSDLNLGFKAEIIATSNYLKAPIISTDGLKINYILGGKEIEYNLSDSVNIGTAGEDIETTTLKKLTGTSIDETNLGLKVIGTLEGEGKADEVGQVRNFSDLSKGSIRAKIRKNAYILTRNLSSGTIINGVKYVEGDISISGNSVGFETLIVKNGNVTISGDLNVIGNKFGIILLKDNYKVQDGPNSQKGNIFIKNSVNYINAIIYADGGIFSSGSDLSNQLVIKGSLFTRNTIGGGVIPYTLPGGKSNNGILAKKYDLNYMRTGNIGFDNPNKNNGKYNNGNKDNFVIIYNPSVQTNPPTGFGQ